MLPQLICYLAYFSTVNGLPTRWRSATVKRDATELAQEYDYIIGKFPGAVVNYSNRLQWVLVQLEPRWATGSLKMATVRLE